MKRRTWKDVDWVCLGMLGWDIDETGAGFYSIAGGLLPDGSSVGHRGVDDDDHVHLDRTTLHIFAAGSLAFLRRRFSELEAAGVGGPLWIINGNSTGAAYGPIISHPSLVTTRSVA